MSKLSKDEIAKIQEDADWWRMVGKILGLNLVGFTYRSSASFSREATHICPWTNVARQISNKCYEVDNYMANAILSAAGKL